MKIFIWKRAENLTGSWHSEGGVCAIAPSLEIARENIASEATKDGAKGRCGALTIPPDFTGEIAHNESAVFIFPDAACC